MLSPRARLLSLVGCLVAWSGALGCTSSQDPPADVAPTQTPAATASPSDDASEQATPAPSPTGPVGWVTGTVVDRSGLPVRGMLVNVLQPREVPEAGVLPDRTARRTITGPNGRFRVRQARQPYLVQICDPDGFALTSCMETAQGARFLQTYVGPVGVTPSWVPQTSLFAPEEASRALGQVTVAPPSTVAGRLVNGANQEVRIMRLNDTPAFRTAADADGRFAFPGMAPGRYYVAAGGTDRLPWRSEEFDLGDDASLEVSGRLRTGATIAGQLISGGSPVAGTDVLISRDGDGVIAAATTDPSGEFTVSGLRAGRYEAGILYDGSEFERTTETIRVDRPAGRYLVEIVARRGATLRVPLVDPQGGTGRVRDELRDADGRPLQVNRNDGSGSVTYPGLPPGTSTVVAATADHYGTRTVTIDARRTYAVAPLRMSRDTLTVTGTTAPGAVAEATTGDLCPPDDPPAVGGFHSIEKADRSGRYALTGVVPGTLMLGADGWPGNYAPRCWSDVDVTDDLVRDLPLARGGKAHGRLVYAATGTPVITTLSYELSYPPGLDTNPTSEHPTRATTRLATGEFLITRLGAGDLTGGLATAADFDKITDLRFSVIHPFQDGTPYWLSTDELPVTLGEGDNLDLGDIQVTLNP